ncbi:MAG: type II toxin-antitoxin system RelE/ParE family toxin [Bacteroidales bacterium]|nr:type II toxin-antitoxin system RelE/ParE family toxin [Bacteroidales bacterium]
MEVNWTHNAMLMADSVLRYTFHTFGKLQADKLKMMFVDATNRLKSFPHSGSVDPFLSDVNCEYRSLALVKPIKMIYYIADSEQLYIVAVWNCRQDADSLHDLINNSEI